MEREEVRKLLSGIFEVVLNQPVQLTDKMTPDDIDNWDSLTNMTIISEIESQWGIKFKLRDIIRMKTVGDIIDTIIKKTC
ncbi:MAG TPA: acyl carrier protein [Prevotella sp.]|jgi:acyl carrier protein|nr:acyl carrier protein [Prevotella sp.]